MHKQAGAESELLRRAFEVSYVSARADDVHFVATAAERCVVGLVLSVKRVRGCPRVRVRFFLVEPKICFHAGDFVARRGAIAPICRRPASLA